MSDTPRYPVRAAAAKAWLEGGANGGTIQEFSRWCAKNGRTPMLGQGVIQVVHSYLWSTARFAWGASGAPTSSDVLFSYAKNGAWNGAIATATETNMEQPAQMPQTSRFTAHGWGVYARVANYGSSDDGEVWQAVSALLNVLTLRIRQGKTYNVDYGTLIKAYLTGAQLAGVNGAGALTNVVGLSPQMGRACPIGEAWDIQPGVNFQGILEGNLSLVPPGSATMDGVLVDLTVELRGQRRDVVAG